jgi:hypothetical protein
MTMNELQSYTYRSFNSKSHEHFMKERGLLWQKKRKKQWFQMNRSSKKIRRKSSLAILVKDKHELEEELLFEEKLQDVELMLDDDLVEEFEWEEEYAVDEEPAVVGELAVVEENLLLAKENHGLLFGFANGWEMQQTISNHRDLFADVDCAVMDNTASDFTFQSILDNCDIQRAQARSSVKEEDDAIRHLLLRLGVLLVKGNAALLLNRIPSFPLPDIDRYL